MSSVVRHCHDFCSRQTRQNLITCATGRPCVLVVHVIKSLSVKLKNTITNTRKVQCASAAKQRDIVLIDMISRQPGTNQAMPLPKLA